MRPTGICPVCAATHKLTTRGVLPRHAFQAKNVRHGQSIGFHIGGHGGDCPIGTESGNRTALRVAQSHDDSAAYLVALPSVTDEEALAAIIRDAQDTHLSDRGSYSNPRPITAEMRAKYATPEAFANTSVRFWFSSDAIVYRRNAMERMRAGEAQAHRDHATLLRKLVQENPAP